MKKKLLSLAWLSASLVILASPRGARAQAGTTPATAPAATAPGAAPVTTLAPSPEAPESAGGTAAPASDSQERDDREDQLTYDPHGRRDPFRPLTGEVAGEDERAKFQGQLRGLLWTEVTLTAIVKTPKGAIATFEGGAKRTGYFAREGDRFWNAVVQRIDYGNATVTIREELTDPRLLKPYRDHPISLKPLEQQSREQGAGSD